MKRSVDKVELLDCPPSSKKRCSDVRALGIDVETIRLDPREDQPEKFARSYSAKHKPVKITRAIDDWDALHRWTCPEGILKRFGNNRDAEVSVIASSSNTFSCVASQYQQLRVKFADFVEYAFRDRLSSVNLPLPSSSSSSRSASAPSLSSCDSPSTFSSTSATTSYPPSLHSLPATTHLYLAQCPLYAGNASSVEPSADIPCTLKPLLDDIRTPWFLQNVEYFTSVNLWLSVRNTSSNLHYDEYDNVLCVVEGTKYIQLFPPSSMLHFDMHSVASHSANHSKISTTDFKLMLSSDCSSTVECFCKNPITHSAIRKERMTCTLRKGDILFIPEGWLHQVDSTSESHVSIAVNWWWKSDCQHFKPDMHSYTLRRVLREMMSETKDELLSGTSSSCTTTLPTSILNAPTEEERDLCLQLKSLKANDLVELTLQEGHGSDAFFGKLSQLLPSFSPLASSLLVRLLEEIEDILNEANFSPFIARFWEKAIVDESRAPLEIQKLLDKCQKFSKRILRHLVENVIY